LAKKGGHKISNWSLPEDKETNKFYKLLEEEGFYSGRHYGSKSGYSMRLPKNVIIFNANMCTKEHGKIFHGDIDITKEEKQLKKLAKRMGVDLYLFYEMDARWETSHNIDFEKALFKITPKIITVARESYKDYYVRSFGKWIYCKEFVKHHSK